MSDVGSPNKQQPILIKIYSRTKNSFWTLAVTPSTTVLRVCEQICDKRGIERGTLSLHYAPLKNLNSFISLQEEALILQQKEHIQKTVGDFDFIVLTEFGSVVSIKVFSENKKSGPVVWLLPSRAEIFTCSVVKFSSLLTSRIS